MSGRVLVVEPDPSGRKVMQRALGGAGHAVTAVASLVDARALLDAGQVRLAIIDEAAGGQALDDVRRLRGLYPRVPVVVTGTLLSQRVLLALMRLGVAGALLKPFSPDEVAETLESVLSRHENEEGVEYAAALALARHALGRGRLAEARAALGRARAVGPLDAEAVALAALVEELSGNDTLANRGFRAALVLADDDELGEGVDPRAGLARLDAYGQARPVERLGAPFRGASLWLVSDEDELRGPPPCPGPLVAALGLGLGGEGIYLRQGPGPLGFALLAGGLRGQVLDQLTELYGLGPRVAQPTNQHGLGEPPVTPETADEGAVSDRRSAP